MRCLVLVLALTVSQLGPLACEVVCSIDGVDQEHDAQGISGHQAIGLSVLSAAADGHECPLPEGGPAVLSSPRLRMLDQPPAYLLSTAIVCSTTTIAPSVVQAVASSPPHLIPPTTPLRI